jgi:hypothetical protein
MSITLTGGRAFLLLLACSLLTLSLPNATASTAVWHCSRVSEPAGDGGGIEKDDFFKLASMGMSSDSIGLTMMDLLDAYSNKTIRVNGRVLTACFMPGNMPLSNSALSSLGLNSSATQQQARQNAIIQGGLQLVTDEAEMAACIAKRYPAVGYLGRVVEDERVVPCF